MHNTKKSQNIYLYKGLQAEGIIEVRVKFICLDSTTVKLEAESPPKFIWLPRLTEQP
jgi:hypothetical protein